MWIQVLKISNIVISRQNVELPYKEVTSSKAFEDRATHILNEMRKQRRSLQLEYVAKVWIHYRVSHFNPISAGVLENQDMLGGGQFDTPSKSHVWCPNITNDTSLESSCALLLESAKKFANLQKLNFLSQNPVIL